jgi:hypothetical protein
VAAFCWILDELTRQQLDAQDVDVLFQELLTCS